MRWSQSFLVTLREVPGDAEVVSHQLLYRAGFIQKLAAGIYAYTPFGFRSLKKKARAVGCDRLILKPCLPDALALQIRDVLNQRQDAE